MNAIIPVFEDKQTFRLENPSFYTKAELQLSSVLALLRENGIHIEEHLHKGSKVVDTMVGIIRERSPVHANLLLIAYNGLSTYERKVFWERNIQPLLTDNFCTRVEELLLIHG